MIDYKTTLLNEIENLCNRIEQESYEKGYIKGKEVKISEDEVYKQFLATLAERTQLYYQAGLNDAWEAAKKLLFTEAQGGLNYETLKEIFNSDSASMYSIMNKYSAEEFILKIKQYEEKKKNKVSNDNNIKKTAYWIDTGSGEQCSNCKEIQYGYDNFRNYCAYCGSEMIDAKKDGVL